MRQEASVKNLERKLGWFGDRNFERVKSALKIVLKLHEVCVKLADSDWTRLVTQQLAHIVLPINQLLAVASKIHVSFDKRALGLGR